MHVDMILAHHSFQNTHVLSITNLDQEFTASWLHFTNQDVVAIFRRPHDVHRQPGDGMAPRPTASHHLTLPIA